MSVCFSDEALEDLMQIGEGIKVHSEVSAARITSDIRQACLALNEMPLRYPLVPAYEQYGIRRRPYGEFLIFYTVLEGDVAIVHILHGARDCEPILFPDA